MQWQHHALANGRHNFALNVAGAWMRLAPAMYECIQDSVHDLKVKRESGSKRVGRHALKVSRGSRVGRKPAAEKASFCPRRKPVPVLGRKPISQNAEQAFGWKE